MQRVDADAMWTLFDPRDAPGLDDVFGEEFNTLYDFYETHGLGRSTMKARILWSDILESQVNTGGPFMLYKDTINRKSSSTIVYVYDIYT
jgi:ribonucleotide reductase alpha subunit